MTTQASTLTPAALVTRAKAEMVNGAHLGSIAASLAAIAELMVTETTQRDEGSPHP